MRRIERILEDLQRERFRLHRLPSGRLYLDPLDAILGRERLVVPYIQPVMLMGQSGESAFQALIDSSGRVLVNTGAAGAAAAISESSDQPSDNTDATVTIGAASQTWEIFHAIAASLVDATVSTRTCRKRTVETGFVKAPPTAPTTPYTAVTLTASEFGYTRTAAWPDSISVFNDNGTVTTGTVAPLPRYLGSIASGHTLQILSEITVNKQAGDRTTVSAFARRVT